MTVAWLIRHGQSTANAGGVTEARGLPPLSELGRAQAETIGHVITTRPDLIVMSNFLRAQQTAAPTIARYPDAPTETWPCVREVTTLDEQVYKNSTQEARGPLLHAYWERSDPHYVAGKGAESWMMLCDRIEEMLTCLTESPHQFVVLFSHGMFMRTVIWYLALGRDRTMFEERMSNFRQFPRWITNGAILPLQCDSKSKSVWMGQLRSEHMH